MRKLEIQHTDDGSATLFVPELEEHYHSVKGAYTESLHIYRDCAFRYASEQFTPMHLPLRLLEIGFGTGLNAAVTAMADRVIRVKNGTVASVTLNEHPQNIAEIEW